MNTDVTTQPDKVKRTRIFYTIRARAKCPKCGYLSSLGHKAFDLYCPMVQCGQVMHKIIGKQFKNHFQEI